MRVLITRPKKQAKNLADSLSQHAISSICFPAIEIVGPKDIKPLKQALANIDKFAILIFVSPNAVDQFLQYSKKTTLSNQILAIGKGTAQVLQQHHIHVTAYPQNANSKSLLALPELQVVGEQAIAIFAGEEGKTLLSEKLIERGAKVNVIYTHRRQLPQYKEPLPWAVESIDVSICTSLSGLHNFRTIITRYALETLLTKPVLVITNEMKMVARHLGFKSAIILAKAASNKQITLALQAYNLNRK